MSILVRQLHNGVYLPAVALGTWQLPSEAAPESVKTALQYGYRAVDDAWIYENEKAVGKAVQDYDGTITGPEKKPKPTAESTVVNQADFLSNFSVPHGKPKDDRKIFVTTKVWVKQFTRDGIRANVDEHLKNFGRSSCDLLLLHWPGSLPAFGGHDPSLNSDKVRIDCWKAMEEVYKEGKVRAIGISNYMVKHLKPLLADIKARGGIVPMVNQIEIHPYLQVDPELVALCKENKIRFTAYSSMGGSKGFAQLAKDPTLQQIAKEVNKPVPNIALRWAMQKEYQILPKSNNPQRVISNFDVMDWELSQEQMEAIDKLNQGSRFVLNPYEIE